MSDDRMDRAKRIREMREGSRGNDDEQTEPEEPSESAGEAGGGNSTSESDPELTDTPSGTEEATTAETATASETAATTESAGVDTETTQQAAEHAASAADDAKAVAQQAAAAATTATESETVQADSTSQGPTGIELPDQELLEEAMANSSTETTEGGARAAAIEEETTQSEELLRVLEFSLGDEYYCLDIEYVEEIVKRNAVTRVPNTPDFVDGVVDLRGQITTILEPKEMMQIDNDGDQNLIVVFDPDKFEEQGAVGWVVDEVRQVVPVTESEVNEPPVDAEYINGVIDRDEYDQFVIWIEPDDALEQATRGDEE